MALSIHSPLKPNLRRSVACLLAAALVCGAGAVHGQRLHKYFIAIDPALTTLAVRACFDGRPPAELVAQSLDATLVLSEVLVEGIRKPIEPSGSLKLNTVPEGGCIVYSVDVSRPIRRHDRSDAKVYRLGGDLLAAVGLWLWRPAVLAEDEDIEMSFLLPDNVSVSAPWRPVPSPPDRPAFRLGHAPYEEWSYVAFGSFREREIRIGTTRLRLAVLEGSPPADVEQMQAWIGDAAQMVANLYGRFPVEHAQVLVVPDTRGNEPAPLAHVVRGGAPAVHFFINQRRAMAEFFADSTAVHEFSHLLLPLVQRSDAWLTEGLASYYQNILRARAGRITAGEAWADMHASFMRGSKGAPGMTLAQASGEYLRNSGAYMRVYWEGAAIMLIADVRLRQMTAGKQSLDTALAALNECCSSPDTMWTAQALLQRLDAITGTGVFGELYERHVASTDFPDLTQTYRSLGIFANGHEIELSAEALEAQLRDAIMDGSVPAHAKDPAE